MDFTLNPEIEDRRQRIRAFVDEHLIPLELKPDSYDAHENIHPEQMKRLQAHARQAGLWYLSMPRERGGEGFDTVCMAARSTEMNRWISRPGLFQPAAPHVPHH